MSTKIWEYKTVTLYSLGILPLDLELEKQGKEGWELCGTFEKHLGKFTLIFKRETE